LRLTTFRSLISEPTYKASQTDAMIRLRSSKHDHGKHALADFQAVTGWCSSPSGSRHFFRRPTCPTGPSNASSQECRHRTLSSLGNRLRLGVLRVSTASEARRRQEPGRRVSLGGHGINSGAQFLL